MGCYQLPRFFILQTTPGAENAEEEAEALETLLKEPQLRKYPIKIFVTKIVTSVVLLVSSDYYDI
ncbi:hypothetical protein NUACC21_03220 [Scytonema sp. NUACC21]